MSTDSHCVSNNRLLSKAQVSQGKDFNLYVVDNFFQLAHFLATRQRSISLSTRPLFTLTMTMPPSNTVLAILAHAADLMQQSKLRDAMTALKEGLTLVKSHTDNGISDMPDIQHIHLFWRVLIVRIDDNTIAMHRQLYGKALVLTKMDDIKVVGDLSAMSVPLEVVSAVFIYNMALCYHCQALMPNSRDLHWTKALALYNSCMQLIDETRVPPSTLALLHLAIYHNVAQVHVCLDRADEAVQYVERVRRILEHTDRTLVLDYAFFYHSLPGMLLGSGDDGGSETTSAAASA
jgi:hypothetical protein